MIFFIFCACASAFVASLMIHSFPPHNKKNSYIFVTLFPVLLIALYIYKGSPALPSAFAKFEKPSTRTELRGLIHSEARLKIEALKDPNNAQRWLKLGSLQLILDQNDEAIDNLSKAFSLEKKDVNIRGALGAALLSQGLKLSEQNDLSQAHKLFERALEIAPREAPYIQELQEAEKRTRAR